MESERAFGRTIADWRSWTHFSHQSVHTWDPCTSTACGLACQGVFIDVIACTKFNSRLAYIYQSYISLHQPDVCLSAPFFFGPFKSCPQFWTAAVFLVMVPLTAAGAGAAEPKAPRTDPSEARDGRSRCLTLREPATLLGAASLESLDARGLLKEEQAVVVSWQMLVLWHLTHSRRERDQRGLDPRSLGTERTRTSSHGRRSRRRQRHLRSGDFGVPL